MNMQTIESLEARQLLAGVTITVGADKAGGIIRIAGTSGDDSIQVALKGKTQFSITVGAQTLFYDRTAIKRLTFIGGDGNDSISLGRVPLKFYAEGGNGNDSLSASNGDSSDTLFGNAGDDYLYAGPGRDTLDGGTGGDVMFGADGNDTIYALSEPSTDDTISGGEGRGDTVLFSQYAKGVRIRVGVTNAPVLSINDVVLGDVEILYGSGRADTLSNESGHSMQLLGGDGNDTLTGGSAPDSLYGGGGRDLIQGSGGDDRINAGGDSADSPDTIVGGSGNADWAYYDDGDSVSGLEGRITADRGPELELIGYLGPDGSDVLFLV